MTPLQQRTLDRLREGPLSTVDPAYASPGLLKVTIYHLREQGHKIETVRRRNPENRKYGHGEYVLNGYEQ